MIQVRTVSVVTCKKFAWHGSIVAHGRTGCTGYVVGQISSNVKALGIFILGLVAGILVDRWFTSRWEDVEELSDDEDERLEGKPLPGECKMILGVRMDLKMDKGKSAAQCGHATLEAYRIAKRKCPENVLMWQTLGQTKIAIKIPDETHLIQLADEARKLGVPAGVIQDAYVFAIHH